MTQPMSAVQMRLSLKKSTAAMRLVNFGITHLRSLVGRAREAEEYKKEKEKLLERTKQRTSWVVFQRPTSPTYCETQRLTDQKLSSSIFPCRSFVCCPSRMVTSLLYDVLGHTNHTFSESSWSKDIKTDITKCLVHKYTNTNTQTHKYSI